MAYHGFGHRGRLLSVSAFSLGGRAQELPAVCCCRCQSPSIPRLTVCLHRLFRHARTRRGQRGRLSLSRNGTTHAAQLPSPGSIRAQPGHAARRYSHSRFPQWFVPDRFLAWRQPGGFPSPPGAGRAQSYALGDSLLRTRWQDHPATLTESPSFSPNLTQVVGAAAFRPRAALPARPGRLAPQSCTALARPLLSVPCGSCSTRRDSTLEEASLEPAVKQPLSFYNDQEERASARLSGVAFEGHLDLICLA